MQIFVDINAVDGGNGTREWPFKNIQQAAEIAMPGDYVCVLPGIYRETVRPRHSGTADKPIIYASAQQNRAIITGAERVTDWQPVSGNVWRVVIDNQTFADYNPYTVVADHTFDHAGEVFLSNRAMYEVDSLEKVIHPVQNELSRDAAFTTYTWYTEQTPDGDATIIYANFHEKDPNQARVEITVRESCFFPEQTGINHIVISGFSFSMAACRWASANYNKGLIGTNTGAGWKIVNCDLAHAKCSGISLGRYSEVPAGDLTVAHPLRHLIKNNTIHDCGQTGIIGVDGNPSPVIEHNNIFNINVCQNLVGPEVSAINLLPSLGAVIKRNCIHDCTRGLWLGGKVTHTKISQNIFYNNALPNDVKVTKANQQALVAGLGEDIQIENSVGVTVIDNNFLLSDCALKLESQGILLVHNLVNGSVEWLSNQAAGDDNTYYHRLHCQGTSQDTASRFFNNIFIRKSLREELQTLLTIAHQQVDHQDLTTNSTQPINDQFFAAQTVKHQDQIKESRVGNVYLDDRLTDIKLDINATGHGVFVDSNLGDFLTEDTGQAISMRQAAGTATDFDTDFLGNQREGTQVTAGPFDHKHEYEKCLFKLFL